MKRRWGIAVILVLAMVFMGASGWAMPLSAGDGRISLSAETLDGEPYEVDAAEINLMGRDGDGYLIHAGRKVLRISAGNIQPLVDSIGSAVASLPTLDSFKEMAKGERSDNVVKLQENLRKTGYLEGSADGDFGPGTQRAVTAFQQATGLGDTGVADAYTQMLLASMAQDKVAISAKLVSGGRFENITNNSNVDLSGAVEKNLMMDFDDLSGIGLITNDNVVRYNVPAAADIDKCEFTFRFGLQVQENNDGSFTVSPAMQIVSVSIRRPIVQEVTLKSGSQRFTISVSDMKSELTGLQSQESATVVLNKEVAGMLAKVKENKELKIRVTCRYNTYDISVPSTELSKIADIGYAAQGL